ncbi:MAG: hypothetical protein ACRC5M_06690 [Anaeroplasmataceae bacterium]
MSKEIMLLIMLVIGNIFILSLTIKVLLPKQIKDDLIIPKHIVTIRNDHVFNLDDVESIGKYVTEGEKIGLSIAFKSGCKKKFSINYLLKYKENSEISDAESELKALFDMMNIVYNKRQKYLQDNKYRVDPIIYHKMYTSVFNGVRFND